MNNMFIINKDGFLVDPETGEVLDEISYRFDYKIPIIDEPIRTLKRVENVKVPEINVKKYLSSLLPQKIREEFLSRVDGVDDNAEIFTHFLVLCRDYGVVFDFNKIREKLGISKISLRRAKKKVYLTLSKHKERVDKIFFEIADKIERKYWLSAVLLTIEYQRRQIKVNINELKKHLQVDVPKSNGYSIYRLFNNKNTVVLAYPYFAYMKCPHDLPAKIDVTKKHLLVRHLGGRKKHDYCFTVTTKKVERLLHIMDYHYEAVKHSTQNEFQLSEEHKQF